MISKTEFINRISVLPKTIPSKTKSASYTAFKFQRNVLFFERVNTKKIWRLDIEELYYVYRTNNFINTSVVKKTMQGRVNSPSVAILIAIGCIDSYGNRIV